MKNILLLLVIFVCVNLAPVQDQVHNAIPGYNHVWYSGYLTFNTGKYHYVYFESQKDPENDPVNWWFNGGPGCSSMMGMFYQNGPFVFQPNSHFLKVNDWSWNKQSNVLYIQTPGGVGFSRSYVNNSYSDETATQDNLKALKKFYQKFPSLKKNQLFLTGQSYAGVYVPYLAKAILDFNKLPNRQLTINLKGFMVNNACTDPRQCYQPRVAHSNSIYQYQYLYKHGFYTEGQYDDFTGACILGYNTEQCEYIRKNLDKKFSATKTSIYNIYAPCYYQDLGTQFKLTQSGGKIQLESGLSCQDEIGMLLYLNEPLMHVNLHVDNMKFETCNEEVASKYKKNPEQSYSLYKQLMKEKIRIWVASGDHDADVPITGTLNWIQRIRQEASLPIEEPWREWWTKGLHKHQDQVGGMAWTLRGLTFATIKGAGHMAHKDKRLQSWTLVNSFLKGIPLPYQQE